MKIKPPHHHFWDAGQPHLNVLLSFQSGPDLTVGDSDGVEALNFIGDYTMRRVIGRSNGGYVKLARRDDTGQKFAIKITHCTVPLKSTESHESIEKEVKENPRGGKIRTHLEAALTMHLHHPNVCRMRELLVDEDYYYMVFSYIRGGTLLDHIIRHGRLQEREARKIAYQIGSALQYLHFNNVVHRDLKLEHILLTPSGDIKLIGFGLSTLFDPASKLTECCATHYFPAPEMLRGESYIGPEIDVWCFGIVMYTLVCGRIPFDGEGGSALRDEILTGHLSYPFHLTANCKDVISKMLLIDPANRATIREVLSHPWTVRGRTRSHVHLPTRRPLHTDDIERDAIHRMMSFGLGSYEDIGEQLRGIISSRDYQDATIQAEKLRRADLQTISPSLLASVRFNLMKWIEKEERRRVFPLKQLVIKVMRSLIVHSVSPMHEPYSKDCAHLFHGTTLSYTSGSTDRMWGFHPLISIYHLAQEQVEREKVI